MNPRVHHQLATVEHQTRTPPSKAARNLTRREVERNMVTANPVLVTITGKICLSSRSNECKQFKLVLHFIKKKKTI